MLDVSVHKAHELLLGWSNLALNSHTHIYNTNTKSYESCSQSVRPLPSVMNNSNELS
jgi:hypothetical protein